MRGGRGKRGEDALSQRTLRDDLHAQRRGVVTEIGDGGRDAETRNPLSKTDFLRMCSNATDDG